MKEQEKIRAEKAKAAAKAAEEKRKQEEAAKKELMRKREQKALEKAKAKAKVVVALTSRASKSKTPADPRTSKMKSALGFPAWSDNGDDMPALGKRTKSSVALTDKRPKKVRKTDDEPAMGLGF